MPTVHLLTAEQAPLPVRSYFAQAPPGPLTASLAHVPELLQATMPFVGRILGASWIDGRTKTMVILRTSALLQCSYCVATYTVAALRAEFSTDQIDALRDSDDASEAFESPKEQALLRWSDAVARGRGPVNPELTSAFKAHFEDAEVVELTLLVGATVMLNRYATALELPIAAAHRALLQREGFTR